MKLEDIGFYTLSDNRAISVSEITPLYRCELILTDRCNFKCPYCRGLRDDISGDIDLEEAKRIVNIWIANGIKNIRFSGGEPTLYDGLPELVKICKTGNVERIAVSTNGSETISCYENLIDCGVNDFSISLDSGCCSVGEKMTGGISGAWVNVVENIRYLSKKTYVSVGMVFTEETVDTCFDDVIFADSLGVSDIRIIPSAQYNKALCSLSELPRDILEKHKILKYRVENIKNGCHVRGITNDGPDACWLGLDDMVSAKGYHFPCVIYMREGGEPIGKITENIRLDRRDWVMSHSPKEDPICKKNCLDVCINYNMVASETHQRIKNAS